MNRQASKASTVIEMRRQINSDYMDMLIDLNRELQSCQNEIKKLVAKSIEYEMGIEASDRWLAADRRNDTEGFESASRTIGNLNKLEKDFTCLLKNSRSSFSGFTLKKRTKPCNYLLAAKTSPLPKKDTARPKRGKVIAVDFKGRESAIIDLTRNYLNDIESRIYMSAINLACSSAWREWNESMPAGSIVDFAPEALFNTGDENVTCLMKLWEIVTACIDNFDHRTDL